MKVISTIPSGERSWFIRRDGAWALLHPHPDGSASVRTATAFETFAPPEGIRDALAWLARGTFIPLEDARALGLVASDNVPPKW